MTPTAFRDHFSGHAADYASYRPTYPDALIDHLARLVPSRSTVWDCATGNGQAAVALARRFDRVVATDASVRQLGQAARADGVSYAAALASRAPLRSASADLVTVAQAIHWFPLEAFYAEVARVLAPGGVVAVWCYSLLSVDEAVDAVLERFYRDVVGPFWPPERHWVDAGYRTLPFPFAELALPGFEMCARWTADQVLAYLGTWSAARRYLDRTGRDPRGEIVTLLHEAWPAPGGGAAAVRFPLGVRAGRVASAGTG